MIGIISDTHENEEGIKKAVEIFRKIKADLVVHCGDIISPPMLDYFRGLKVKFVLGNNDGEIAGINKKARELGFEEVAEEKEFEYGSKKFYAYHGTMAARLDAAIKSDKYDYVLTGHTHMKRDERIGKTRVINPGALFRVKSYTIALLDTDKDELKFVKI